jgi:signal transduction histidine kinase
LGFLEEALILTSIKFITQSLSLFLEKGKISTVMIIGDKVIKQPEAEITQLKHFILLLSIFLLALGMILLFIYIINQRLKKEISSQTHKLRMLNENLKEKQKNIADSNAFKEQILNNIDTAIVTFGLDFRITSCNSCALDMLSLTEITPFHYQHSLLLDQLEEHYKKHKKIQKTSKTPLILDTTVNGQRKVLSYRIFKMFDSGKIQTGYILSINDETEKKKLEQKLITQEKLHALGQLVAGVAHEIRNPLTSIKTFIDLLPKKYDLPQFREMMLVHLPVEVNRMNMIVSDLVDFARPRPPQKQHCPASEFIQFLAFLQVTIEKKQIVLEQTIDENLIFYIDIQQIRQVILNILLNAISAVEEMSERKISIIIEKDDEDLGKIIISDTGNGIRDEELNRIFEPFYTSKEKGVGLGLTLSYKLIKENNGDIQVISKLNEGTTFIVTLPLLKEVIQNETAYLSHR